MTIKIGDRGLESMTEQELGKFLYDHGYCGSSRFWALPVFTEFELFMGNIHFTFEQTGTSGQSHKVLKRGIMGQLNDDAHFSYMIDNDEEEVRLFYLKLRDLKYFLKLGFKIDLEYKKPNFWNE